MNNWYGIKKDGTKVMASNEEIMHFAFNAKPMRLTLLWGIETLILPDGTRTGGYIVKGHTFYKQLMDPQTEGWIGYRKPFYQSNGIFGDEESVKKTMQKYAKFKSPPAELSFET